MVFDVKGKTAIVTGAASGFGKELVLRLVKKGANVVLVDYNKPAGTSYQSELASSYPNKTVFVHADTSSRTDMLNVFRITNATFHSLDIIVNNAGIGQKYELADDEDDTWMNMLNIDVVGVILGCRMAISQWKKEGKKGGIIINTASLAGLYPQANMPVYCSAKAAVVMLTRSLAHLKSQGIRVNAICPSFSPTGGFVSNPNELDEFTKARIVTVAQVVDAFEKAIEDDSLAGELIRITPEFGIDLYKSRKQPVAKI
ncbi:hypothetical protein SmJEL517_g01604 [Synchytrium microbalum]|uniref:NAD(P)-binding protein n=1 Tax=Synchytrium microbalum TaxID=1806994 RepID=A0A507CF28_9FUNG|nr:uncharacterized protein SmJEL517_g01604 [Synchytrium microbalum]TPX36123.1 hypothetical protein SmJEL517_g01604 [Synchytrium microbalum]